MTDATLSRLIAFSPITHEPTTSPCLCSSSGTTKAVCSNSCMRRGDNASERWGNCGSLRMRLLTFY